MNLAAAAPHPELASSRFCLADPGRECLVFLPQGGEVTVDLAAASGKMQAEWLAPTDGTFTRADPVAAEGKKTLRLPFAGEAVLHLWKN